jgi:hypothetical protein
MSYELAAILVVGVVMGLAQAAAIVTAVSGIGAMAREMNRTRGEVNRGLEETRAEANRSFEETRAQMNRGF